MSESRASKAHAWMLGISVAVVVIMAAVLFGQVRLIAQQNHNLMIDNQNLEIEVDQLWSQLQSEANRVAARLDRGMPLASTNGNRLNINEQLEGPLIGALVRQVQNERPLIQLRGLKGLTQVQPVGHRREVFAPIVVPAVIPTLRDERLRLWAMNVLRQYASYAAAAAPTVLETSDATRWDRTITSIRDARSMDPKCDYMPLLIRHVKHSNDDWKATLKNLQHSFTDQEVLMAYQGALDQASDENLRRRYAGVVRYLKDRPPAGALQPPRDVDEYIQEEGATKSE
ncbi:hypothetical protein [Bremerella sp.]|uniref:hypothetical protein n=1 Tax=Bremerella sp. TaxID=2795602 RepID=UPI00391C1652